TRLYGWPTKDTSVIATATSQIRPLSLHDALPIFGRADSTGPVPKLENAYDPKSAEHIKAGTYPKDADMIKEMDAVAKVSFIMSRSEEHTSELQSREKLVCRLLLEKKNTSHIYLSY